MLVGALPFQSRYLLSAALVISLIAELASVGAQADCGAAARSGVMFGHRFVMVDRQLLFENFDGACFADRAGLTDSAFKLLSEFAC